ncbi:transmembrane protein 17B-like [Halichondria panicea]|uniref:transmembrane protein 17B-like n=1 Tax=Halichondria panicea TaxID=6063 RepID=UPI00312B9E17
MSTVTELFTRSGVRQRVGGVSEHPVRTNSDYNRLRSINLLPGADIVIFLPLQMSLYFNAFYSPLWLVTLVVTLQTKYAVLATHYQFATILIYIVMVIVETARLYLGYQGNLREKIPELTGFWLLTLLQTPLTLYLLVNMDAVILPLERAVNIVLLLFLLAQLLLGLRALQLMVKAQAVKFHLSQFSSLRDETVTN